MQTEEDIVKEERSGQTNLRNNAELRKKLLIFGGIGVGIIVVIVLIIFIANMITGRRMSYTGVEQKMREAAISYYKENKNLLPSHEGEVTVDAVTLSTGKFMKPLEKMVPKGASCTGKVVVKQKEDTYSYTSYLDCGKAYTTVELYKKLIDQSNIVTTGDGLYQMNNEYIFRGENVNNYLKIGDNIWRIVKLTANNEFQVILYDSRFKSLWDDRYNSERNYNVGINDFKVSRVRTYLEELYSNEKIFDELTKGKMMEFDLCYGKRAESSATNNNSIECSSKLEKQKIGLLTLSDYINASLDVSCKASLDPECQNYNYLGTDNYYWWLLTSSNENTFRVYCVSSSGYVQANQASGVNYIRPVIQLSNTTMYASGDGTLENPYVIR